MPDNVSALHLAASALAGAVMGLVFFAGLWWTVRRAASSPRPALWFGPSLLLRLALVGAGFVAISDGAWPTLLACLAGFVLARFAVLRLTRQSDTARLEAQHAS